MRVPDDVRPFVHKTEITRTLRTKTEATGTSNALSTRSSRASPRNVRAADRARECGRCRNPAWGSLLPHALTDPGKEHARTIHGRIAAWVREIGVDDPNVAPNHGWRHRMSSILMGLRARKVEIDAILGHEGPSYGKVSLRVRRALSSLARANVRSSLP
jgi:integrase